MNIPLTEKPMVRMLFTLPEDMKQALDEASKNSGICRARLIRDGLDLVLKNHMKQRKEE